MYLHDTCSLCTYLLCKKPLCGLPPLKYEGMGEKQGSGEIWNEHGSTKPEDSK